MRFKFPVDKTSTWSAVLPAGPIQDDAGRVVDVSERFLRDAVSETQRYYKFLKDNGRFLPRPILPTPHQDAGRRIGDLLDAEVVTHKGKPTLFLKLDWREGARRQIEDGTLLTGSVRIVPEFVDAQSGERFGPFIKEYSATAEPKVTNFVIGEFLESPSQLAELGLTLSENKGVEEMAEQNAVGESEEQITIEAVSARVDELAETFQTGFTALNDSLSERFGEIDARFEALAPADDAPAEVAASENGVADLVAKIDALTELVNANARANALNTVEQGSPEGISASENEKPKVTLSIVKRETGLKGAAACNAFQAIQDGRATFEDYKGV